MNPQPKQDLAKHRRKISLFAAWLMAFVMWIAIIILIVCVLFPEHVAQKSFDYWLKFFFYVLLGGIASATTFIGGILFVGWARQWRNFKRVLFGCACLATLIAVFYAEEDWRGKHDWERFKRQWEAKGENFDIDSVVPRAVPDDKNFAMSPVWIAELKRNYKNSEAWYGKRIYSEDVSNYCKLLPMSVSAVTGTNDDWSLPAAPNTLGDWAVARMTDLKPWQLFYRNLERTNPSAEIAIAPNSQKPAQDVLLALSKYDPLIERLRLDSKRPFSRFPIEYGREEGFEVLLPHLAGVKQCAKVLELRALAELQFGQSAKAMEDVELMLRLMDANRDEPLLISHLVRLAVLQVALQPIYEGLANHEWSDPELAELNSELTKVDLLEDYKFAMRGEMIFCQDGFVDDVRRHPDEIFNVSAVTESGVPFFGRVMFNLIPEGWFYQNEFHDNRSVEEFVLPVADTNQDIISPASERRADTAIEKETERASPYNVLERISGVLSATAITFAYGQNAANLARVALALERYRLAHGEYPNSLNMLEPQFITPLPHDIINGQPLHYQRTAGGQFKLYSVGWNETDDGGVVVFKKGSTPGIDRKKGDWVWRYPAKQLTCRRIRCPG
jgi:hypothetical protein